MASSDAILHPIRTMLGHPGISAFEYAGAAESHNADEKRKEKERGRGFFKRAFGPDAIPSEEPGQEDVPQPGGSSESGEYEPSQTPIEGFTITQRRRGTFVNHTPRTHEVHSPTKSLHRENSSEDLDRLYTSYGGSSDDNISTSISQRGHHSSYDSSNADYRLKVNANGPVELEDKKAMGSPSSPHQSPAAQSKPVRSQSPSVATSVKSSQTGISKRSFKRLIGGGKMLDASVYYTPTSLPKEGIRASKAATNSARRLDTAPSTRAGALENESDSLSPTKANNKRRRRQTPYEVPQPLAADTVRHAPLAPLVAIHRREVTGSDVDALPPHVDIDNDINESTTLMALSEHFNNQESHPPDQPSEFAYRLEPSKSELPPAQAPPLLPTNRSSFERSAMRSVDSLGINSESMPTLPERNPERLSRISSPTTSRHVKSTSELSIQSDFASAAQGQYSPYEERFNTVPTVLRAPPPVPIHACAAPTTPSGRLAPQIPAHEELTSSSRLNDFNYFLRMTGPTSTNNETKKPPVIKKKKKDIKFIKPRNKKNSENELAKGHPPHEPLPPVPACAREMTTASGAKHLQIVIPASDVAPNQTTTLPVYNQQGHASRVSVLWSEEMLQPLASTGVERTAAGSVLAGPSSPRSLEPKAVSPNAVPIESHPLLVDRKEQTRTRKLRDLAKAKGKAVEEADDVVDDRVVRMEWLAKELADALAKAAGLDVNADDMEAEQVLEAYKAMARRSG